MEGKVPSGKIKPSLNILEKDLSVWRWASFDDGFVPYVEVTQDDLEEIKKINSHPKFSGFQSIQHGDWIGHIVRRTDGRIGIVYDDLNGFTRHLYVVFVNGTKDNIVLHNVGISKGTRFYWLFKSGSLVNEGNIAKQIKGCEQ